MLSAGRRLSLFCLALIILTIATTTSAAPGAGMPVRRIAPGDVANEYIVSLQNVARDDVDRAAREIAAKVDGQLVAVWKDAVTAFWIRVPAERANRMFADPRVKGVEQNARVYASGVNPQPTGVANATVPADCQKPGVQCVQPSPVGTYPEQFQPHPLWHLARISHRTRGHFDYPYQNAGSGVIAYLIDGGALRFHQEFVPEGQMPDGSHLNVDSAPRMVEVPGSNVIATRLGPDRLPSTAPHTDCNAAAPFRRAIEGLYYASEYPWFVPVRDQGVTDHGTGVASSLGGRNTGVAKDVTLIPVKSLACGDRSSTADMIAAINWIYAAEQSHYTATGSRRRVVLSISTSKAAHDNTYAPPLQIWGNEPGVLEAIEAALEKLITDHGVPVFVAADNFKKDACTLTPQRLSRRGGRGQVITVGGLDKTADEQWISSDLNGSNVGQCVDIIAPAEHIPVAYSSGWSAYRAPANSSGTSYATPIVAGIAARMLAEDGQNGALQTLLNHNPSELPREIWRRLIASATVLPEVNGANPAQPLGAGSPNAIAYMGVVGLVKNPQSFDFRGTPDTVKELTVEVPAGARVCGYEWWKSASPSYEYASATLVQSDSSDAKASAYSFAAKPASGSAYYWARVKVCDVGSTTTYTESAMARLSDGCAVITQQPLSKWATRGQGHTFTIGIQGDSSRYIIEWHRGTRGNPGPVPVATGPSLTVPADDNGTFWARIMSRTSPSCIIDSDVAHFRNCALPSSLASGSTLALKVTADTDGSGGATIEFATPPAVPDPKAYYLLEKRGGEWVSVASNRQSASFWVAASARRTYKIRVAITCTYVDSEEKEVTPPQCAAVTRTPIAPAASSLLVYRCDAGTAGCGHVQLTTAYPQDVYMWCEQPEGGQERCDINTGSSNTLTVWPQRTTTYFAYVEVCPGKRVKSDPRTIYLTPEITLHPQKSWIYRNDSNPPTYPTLTADGIDPYAAAATKYEWYVQNGAETKFVASGKSYQVTQPGEYFFRITSAFGPGIANYSDSKHALVEVTCSAPRKRRPVRSSIMALEFPPAPVPPGSAVKLSIEDLQDGTTFEWYEGNSYNDQTRRVGDTASVYVRPYVTTTYWALSRSGCDQTLTTASEFITVTVQCDPNIFSHPQSIDAPMGASGQTTRVSTSVVPSGGGPFTYKWYIVANDGTRSLDAAQTGATYHWDYVVPPEPRPERVERKVQVEFVSDCGGSTKVITSRVVTLAILSASRQRILAYSSGDTIYGARPGKLYVRMDPDPSTTHVYQYEWFEEDGSLNGRAMSGDGSEMLVNVDPRGTFWAKITGTHTLADGSKVTEVTYSPKMYVWQYGACALPPLQISQSIHSIPYGTAPDVVFTAVCDWPETTFQWYEGQRGDTRNPVASDPNKPHQLTVSSGSIRTYWVRVSLVCGASEDSPTLTYRRDPCGPMLINQNIASVEVPYGGSATVAVAPVAVSRPVYRWFEGAGEASPVQSGGSPTYQRDNVTASTRFWVRVSDIDCSTNSDSYLATVRVASCPSLTTPVWQSEYETVRGATATIGSVVEGATTYRWFIGEVGDPASQEIGGATSATYTTPALTAATKYWVRASNATCSIDSPTMTVKVCVPPAESQAPHLNSNIVAGQWTPFEIHVTGTNLAYQWYQGSRLDTSTPVGWAVNRLEVWPQQTTNYWVRVTGRCGTYDSPTFTASVCPVLQTPVAANPKVMPGQSTTISLNATGTGLSYQWYSGPVGDTSAQYKVANGTGSTLTTPAINAPMTFWCYVQSGQCYRYSQPVTVGLCDEPTVRWQHGDKVTTKGGRVYFYLDAAHSTQQPVVTVYAGNKGDTSTVIYGPSTTEDFNLLVTETRKYWARAVVGNCSSDSSEITVTVCIPQLTQQPAGGNITLGGSHKLTVAADIVPPGGYEWFIGESGNTAVPVPNSNAASITVSPTADSKYWARAKGCGSNNADSVAVLVTVCTPASVKSHTQSTWIVKGATKELVVEAGGTSSTVRWYRGAVGDLTNPISSTPSVFVTPTDTTTYWARVSNGCGSADTPAVVVSVCAPPGITTQPQSQTIFSGNTATLSVVATQSTSTPMTYQWFSGATSGSGTAISGATAASYTTPALTASTSYWVRVTAGTSTCVTNSSVATISMCGYPPVIDAPADKDIAVGGSARLDLNVSPVPQSYKWYRGAQGDRTNLISSGAYHDVTPSVTTQYWGEVTHNGCTAKTRTVTVYVSKPTFTLHPASVQVNGGVAAPLTASADTAGVTYQWFEGTSGSGTAISGATNASYSVPGRAGGTVANFWVRATGSRGHVTNSNTATVTWCNPAYITQEPQDRSIRRGSSTWISVAATGTNLRYQWYRGTSGNETYGINNTTDTLTVVPTDPETYWVKVTSDCGIDNSITAKVDVCVDPAINVQPVSQAVYANSSVTLSVSATAGTNLPLSYQWYEGTSGSGTAIAGATGASYTTPAITGARNYWVKVTSGVCSINSNTAALTVCSYAQTVNAPSDMYITYGKQTLLKVQISPVPTSGAWYRGVQGDRTNKISNQTQVYVYPEQTTQYWAEMVGPDGCKTMTRTMTVNVCVPTILEQPQSTSIAYGSSATLSVNAREGVTYQWYRNDVAIPGATSPTLDTGAMWEEKWYQVVITGSCGVSVNSAYATVSVY